VGAASTGMAPAASVQTWLLLNVPPGLLLAGIVAACVGLGLGGLVIVRRNVELRQLEAHQDVAGFILAVVGVVYAVLLAFVVIIVWEQFDATRAEADREATLVLALYRDAVALDDLSPDVRRPIRRYAELVVEEEWPLMAEMHRESRRAEDALNDVWTAFRAMQPRTRSDSAFYDAAVRGLHEISEIRRARVADSGSGLLPAMWAVLIVGGVISVAFTYFFGVRSFAAQALMVSALAALIGLVLALILSLDLPFTGGVAVGPDRMQDVIEEFDHT
jgi:Protein of unknown function (DUF4239)